MRKESIAKFTMLILAGCCTFFALDVFIDLFGSSQLTTLNMIHLLVESIATLSILASLLLLRDYIRVSRAQEKTLQATLDSVKQGLNNLIFERVNALQLTPAEREVALMTLKGYTLPEIATLRGTSEGTTKAQAHAVYQKAKVSSRAELILFCIEDAVAQSIATESPPSKLRASGEVS